ncbi:MAG: hypothetical protein HGB23_06800 [Chlorobiaceae bacterium]|nr:hypothetical protein [Chlorobiaceae bacterium]
MNEKYLEETHYISKDELLENVSLSVLRNSTAGIPGLCDWPRFKVNKEPLEIFDVNGKSLFYDFAIENGVETVGFVRASASKVIGSPVVAYEIGSRYWNVESAQKRITPRIRKEYPRQKISTAKLVCYSYPKLGLLFELSDVKGKKTRLIFDVADYSLISERASNAKIEGAFAWSFYDSISEEMRKERLRRYEQSNKWRLSISEQARKDLRSAGELAPFLDIKDFICKLKLNITRELQFCSHYNYNESRSHHCFSLHAQQVNDYCAVATCQMILCYYRYYYTQDDIAPELGYSSGGCPSDQSAGYEALTGNHLDATFDSAPTWETARDQIDALRPFKSGISGHARACAGYSSVWWLCDGVKDKKLYIYDPWPWNADYKVGGAVYWEDWDSITHTNYVLTRLIYP